MLGLTTTRAQNARLEGELADSSQTASWRRPAREAEKRLDVAAGGVQAGGVVGITDSAQWEPPVPLDDQPTPGRNPR